MTEERGPVHGRIRLSPTFQIAETSLLHSAETPVIVGEAEVGLIRRVTVVPVARLSDQRWLQERQADGWKRVVAPPATLQSAELNLFPPLVLSSRKAWHFDRGYTNIFDNAWIIKGAHRLLQLLVQHPSKTRIAFTAFTGLSPELELQLHSKLSRLSESPQPGSRIQVGSDTQRLVVGTSAVTFTIESEPFVIPTTFGYSPAILIRRPTHGLLEHVLIQARSIAMPLEQIRQTRGSLVGVSVQVRKSSEERTASFDVLEVK